MKVRSYPRLFFTLVFLAICVSTARAINPLCVNVFANPEDNGEDPCPFIGDPSGFEYPDGVEIGKVKLLVCGGTIVCQGSLHSAITISIDENSPYFGSDYLSYMRNVRFFVDGSEVTTLAEPGWYNVTVKFDLPSCHYQWADFGNYETTEATVLVTVTVNLTGEMPNSCGPCMPQAVQWRCNQYTVNDDPIFNDFDNWNSSGDASGYYLDGNQGFYNRHVKEFYLDGISQGSGLTVSETFSRVVKRTWAYHGGRIIDDTGEVDAPPPTPTWELKCMDTCSGTNKTAVTDRYVTGFWDEGLNHYQIEYGLNKSYGTKFIWYHDTQWINQHVYVNDKLIGSGFAAHVVLRHEIDVQVDSNGDPVGASRSNWSATKTGNI